MIINCHVRKDYREWREYPKTTVLTMCGKKTLSKFTGIPGVTPNQPIRIIDRTSGDYSWCLKCMIALREDVCDRPDVQNVNLASLYRLANDMADLMLAIAGGRADSSYET